MRGHATHPLLALAGALVLATPCAANTYVVDDTSTIPYESNLVTRWKDNATTGGRQMSNDIEGAATVTLRLNVQPWLNRNGRIYLALPQQPIGVVNVEWSTQGRLLPGKLQSGERTLVYAGPIRTSVLEDTFNVHVVADGRRVNAAQRLNFHFEIDVD
ncbi:MAG TPA: hypothetical protein VMN56_21605 [Casimicrobiaceae bacterium]|nr:hypothetical protein [Casimicrobiaceae bacterium]